MRLKRNFIHRPEDIPENWRDLTVILWEEDDARPSDAETLQSAFDRITGGDRGAHIHEIDEGDAFYRFYRGGWVKACCCDGGWVGVLIDPPKDSK